MRPPLPIPRRTLSLARVRAWAALAFVAGFTSVASACRYNVRDVGFVDLETDGYRLCWFPGDRVGEADLARLKQAAGEALSEANVAFEVVPVDAPAGHPVRGLRQASEGGAGAEAILVAPDGPAAPLAFGGGRGEGRATDTSAGAMAEAVRALCQEAVRSPTRDAVVVAARRTFGVVLFIEGTEAPANQRARAEVDEALEAIRRQMPTLPKAIAEPPVRVDLAVSDLVRERVLLWTLRQDTRPTPEPRLAIVYGRARWIGPVMRGEEISVRNVSGIFSLIGADCECGLDLAWTQGTRIPIRWEERERAGLAKALGFDPDNPVVKSEVSWIVSRRGLVPSKPEGGRGGGLAAEQGAASGLGSGAGSGPAPGSGAVPVKAGVDAAMPAVEGLAVSVSPGPPIRVGWWLAGGSVGLVLGIGGVLAWRAWRRD